MTKLIKYDQYQFPAPSNVTTVEQARQVAQMAIPGLGDAKGYIDTDGNFVFVKEAGTKGL